jgi:hypothetical protein
LNSLDCLLVLGPIGMFMGFAWIMNEFFGNLGQNPHCCACYSNSSIFRGNFRRTLLRQTMKNKDGDWKKK